LAQKLSTGVLSVPRNDPQTASIGAVAAGAIGRIAAAGKARLLAGDFLCRFLLRPAVSELDGGARVGSEDLHRRDVAGSSG
jgi:hypothetical protein